MKLDQSNITLREANVEDASALTRLAIRSKAHWGYSDDFMRACEAELSVLKADIKDPTQHIRLAELADELLGFYCLEDLTGDTIELGALFVDPAYIGSGIGRRLMQAAKQHAVELGANKMTIQGDPQATGFYLAAGAKQTGSKASESIAGRYLPTFQVDLVD